MALPVLDYMHNGFLVVWLDGRSEPILEEGCSRQTGGSPAAGRLTCMNGTLQACPNEGGGGTAPELVGNCSRLCGSVFFFGSQEHLLRRVQLSRLQLANNSRILTCSQIEGASRENNSQSLLRV